MPCVVVDTLAGVMSGYGMGGNTDGKESQTYRARELEEGDCGRHRDGSCRATLLLFCR